jgi:hypothetical protein
MYSCHPNSDKSIEENKSIDSLSKSNSKQLHWYDSLVMTYVHQTDNLLVKSTREANFTIDWELDRTENTDSAKYLVFHIGHDMVDEGNTNPRFATDAWVYIDSIKRTLFEYDLASEQLIKWINKN